MARERIIIKYNVDNQVFYLNVDIRKNSLGINVASRDMLEICYKKSFAVLRDMSYQLMRIHQIEKIKRNFGGEKFSKTLFYMSEEILCHMDYYIWAENNLRGIKIIPDEYKKYFDILEKAFSLVSIHTKDADIGANLSKDWDGAIINLAYSTRNLHSFYLNKLFYHIGKHFLISERNDNVKYICEYKSHTIMEISKKETILHNK